MRVAFWDSSASVELIVEEPKSASLRQDLRGYSKVVASELAAVEVPRIIRRRYARRVALACRLVCSLETAAFDTCVMQSATSLEPPELRSIDAHQLACALRLAQLGPVFVAYDRRIIRAALLAGLSTLFPSWPHLEATANMRLSSSLGEPSSSDRNVECRPTEDPELCRSTGSARRGRSTPNSPRRSRREHDRYPPAINSRCRPGRAVEAETNWANLEL